MRILRYEDGSGPRYARALGDGTAVPCDGDPFAGLVDAGDAFEIDKVRLLPPVVPTKVIGVGLNYRDHAAEHHAALPTEPLLFHKPPSALLPHGGQIQLHHPENRNDEEIELVVVIGRRARRISVGDALDYVLGYTIGNDVTDRDTQVVDRNWPSRAKGFDSYGPVGPWIETDLDPSGLGLRATINGVIVQEGNTSDLLFDVAHLVSFISHVSTLEPGDMIFTGTPSGVSEIRPGDEVALEIEGIGTLRNSVGVVDGQAGGIARADH